jgi:hypothetical protein
MSLDLADPPRGDYRLFLPHGLSGAYRQVLDDPAGAVRVVKLP